MNKYSGRAAGGLSFFFLVVTLGLILAWFNIGVGLGASIRIPFTDHNFSAAGSIGKKEVVQNALPDYLRPKIASNQDFFNQSSTLTFWLAEGMGILVIGRQPEVPVFDIKFNLIR